jgi:hypothetical protein
MTITVNLRRRWDGVLMRTDALQPTAAHSALLDWQTDRGSVDAGIPIEIAAALSRYLTAKSTIAGRWFETVPVCDDLTFVPAPRRNLARRFVERLTNSAPMAAVITRSPDMLTRLFDQAWDTQGQMLMVLAPDASANDLLAQDLSYRRDWVDFAFPQSVTALIAPGVDGDFLLVSAPSATALDYVLSIFKEAFSHAGFRLGPGMAT